MERFWFNANLAEVLVARDDFDLVRMHCPPGDMPPLHLHEREDEGFYLLSGSATLWVGDDVLQLVPGEFALAPHGVPHTYRAGDEGGVFLVTSTPGGFATFLREAGEPAASATLPVPSAPDVERLGAIAAAHGITLLGPPGMLPGELLSPATATA